MKAEPLPSLVLALLYCWPLEEGCGLVDLEPSWDLS